MNSKDFIALEEQYGAHNYHPLDVVVHSAQGAWVTDVEGKKYLDCLAAYSAVNQGHCHPRIAEAFIEQVSRVTLTSRAFRNDRLPLLYKKLHDMTGYEMSLPMNSGAEAVETAIKTARRWGYDVKGIAENKAEIVVATGNFHGRTTTIVGFSDDPSSFKGFGPYCTEAFPMHEYGNIEDLRAKITPNTCAVMIEPIQGEGGVVIPPDGYLKAVAELCKEQGILFICDEIQSGLGRSGKLFACYYEDVRPDIVIIGKALSG
ncbi:MAG: aminotransferase class III-fold pyridoxal phosphate-dependent enzyme, partial [Bacteroidetes bacterium]|nr:aminotransferase class III-fold pyridoxal phosphate-dependent enzyme [Bacteroidota bacterium]